MNPEMNPSNGPSSDIDVTTVIRLMMEQISTFGQTVGQLQGQVNELNTRLSTDPMPTSSIAPRDDQNPMTAVRPEKSERHPNPELFDGNRRDLRPFVTKLRLKLSDNHDRYPTEEKKVNYSMSRLKGDAACTMDPFFRSGAFGTLDQFISLLERTYDDASRKHSAATKLEGLKQRNREFTSFFSEFLGLIGELEWNEAAKVDALRRKVSDEVKQQLIGGLGQHIAIWMIKNGAKRIITLSRNGLNSPGAQHTVDTIRNLGADIQLDHQG